jgi:divinyl chlorophyllide a 8-vinyl-reductase
MRTLLDTRVALLLLLPLLRQAAAFATVRSWAPTASRAGPLSSLRMSVTEAPEKVTVAVAGATGYIGKFCVQECVRRGYNTIAVARKEGPGSVFEGATTVVADVTDPASLEEKLFKNHKVDVVISCLASRSGTKSDSWLIDYQATANCLNEGVKADLRHFVLLSAFCVRKPLLEFQKAKLKFEKELRQASDASDGKLTYSVVRPTAFFKSVSGQLEVVKGGFPFVVFGDGTMCKCNPISEADLATYMVDCIADPSKNNKILDLGGPDEGYTMAQQGELLAEACGVEPNIMKAPVGLFDAIIGALDFGGRFLDSLQDAAELARIGKYYAVEVSALGG